MTISQELLKGKNFVLFVTKALQVWTAAFL